MQKCNNSGGTLLEKHLVNKLNFEEALQGLASTSINGKVILQNDTELTAKINIVGDGGVYIETNPNRSKPTSVSRILSMANNREEIGNFSLTLKGNYRQGRPEVALIRIAYLLAYSTFGFGFLLNFNLQMIRDQIKSPKKKLLKHWGIISSNFPNENLGVNLIYEPKELKSFLIVFDLKTRNRSIRYGVLLPGPTDPGIEIYNWLMLPENQKVNYCAKKIPDDDYLKKPELAFASSTYWNLLR